MLNYTNELALPNISNSTKHRGERREEEVHGGGSGGGESHLSGGVIAEGEERREKLKIVKHKRNNREK